MRYHSDAPARGQSSRGVIGAIRRDIAAFARSRHRDDLAELFVGPARKGPAAARAMAAAIEQLRNATVPVPLIGDGVGLWLEPRVAVVLRNAGIKTLADLTLRHASLSTTSMYLHSDDLRRAKQIGGAFEAPAA